MTGAADACVDKDIFIYECFDLIPDGLVELVRWKADGVLTNFGKTIYMHLFTRLCVLQFQ